MLLLARCWDYRLKTEDVLELTQVSTESVGVRSHFFDQFFGDFSLIILSPTVLLSVCWWQKKSVFSNISHCSNCTYNISARTYREIDVSHCVQ